MVHMQQKQVTISWFSGIVFGATLNKISLRRLEMATSTNSQMEWQLKKVTIKCNPTDPLLGGFSPTHLKNILLTNWIMKPIWIGVNIKKSLSCHHRSIQVCPKKGSSMPRIHINRVSVARGFKSCRNSCTIVHPVNCTPCETKKMRESAYTVVSKQTFQLPNAACQDVATKNEGLQLPGLIHSIFSSKTYLIKAYDEGQFCWVGLPLRHPPSVIVPRCSNQRVPQHLFEQLPGHH